MRKLPLHEMRTLVRFALRRLEEERLPEVAGSLTFTTVLALVPVLTVVLAVFTAFPIFETFRAAVEDYFLQTLVPGTIADTIIENLNQFAAQARTLSAIGAIGLVVTTIVTMLTIDSAFNHIWRVKTPRPLLQRVMVYWTLVTFGPLLAGVSVTVTSDLYARVGGWTPEVPMVAAALYTLVSVLLTAFALTLLYMAVPNRYVDWRDAAWGGVLAAIAFEAAKTIFVVFITGFPTYAVVYGALAALPIFLLWVYVSWLIALIGAVIAAALPVVKHERWWHVAAPGSTFIDAMAVLKVLVDARAHGSNAAVDAGTLRAATRLGYDELESLLQRMLEVGWVGRMAPLRTRRVQFGKRINEGRDRWVLTHNPDQLTVADVYRLFAFNTMESPALALQVDEAVSAGLA
ncbi:MAG TPA: YihY family inner membrane protein, partial [Noviherbaspirillum sp.]|nr:YihY family inner membrane protein [Noviherbaspirillum sp.]